MKSIHQKYFWFSKIILPLTISFISLNSFSAGVSITTPSNESPHSWQQLGLMNGFPPNKSKLVTKSNFMRPPYNRWAFQHMRYLNFTAPVERGASGATKFEIQPQDLMNKKFNINKQSQSLLSFVKQSYTDSLLVLYKGKIVTEYYVDGMTEQTPHWTASITKSFVGTLADLLIYRGLLNPNKTISSYIPELQKSAYGSATVQQVLDMQAGVDGHGDFSSVREPGSYYNTFGKAMGSLPSSENSNMYDLLPQAKSIDAHGKKFRYASPTTEVASWLLSRITNKPLEVLLSQEIWSKLGSSGEAYTLVDYTSTMIGSGGLNSTTRDLARFGQMIANNGKFNNQQILPTEVIQSIMRSGNKLPWKNGEFSEMIPYVNSYHSYWYQTENKYHAIMAMGVYGQDMYIDPINDVVIVKFASYPGAYVDAYDDGWTAVCPQIVEALINGA
jgi:CubicO group peptidase (beta-lactamase class C family)